MADQAASLPAAAAREDTRSAHQLILDSVNRDNSIGSGLQGEVYRFATQDPFFDQFLIKRSRIWANVPGQDEASFKRKLKSTSALVPVSSPLDGYNYGQPLMMDEAQRFSIIIKQRGAPLDMFIRHGLADTKGLNASFLRLEERYHLYLNWLLREVSDSTFIDFYQKIRRVNTSGMAVDPGSKGNIFWDNERQQFNLIDLNERYQLKDLFNTSRSGSVLRRVFFQIPSAALRGVGNPNLPPQDEMFRLLIMNAEDRYRAAGMSLSVRSGAEAEQTKRLETELQQRLQTLFNKYTPPMEAPLPKTTLQVPTIENMAISRVGVLKERLQGMLAHNEGFVR